MWNKLRNFFQKLQKQIKVAQGTYTPFFKVVEITKLDDGDCYVTIQVINSVVTFTMRPEEILAKNDLVDQFSPRDIRTLAYLGYLEINSPKYKILANSFLQNQDKIVFVLKKKGEQEVILKTADEILNEKDIIGNLASLDAKDIGYTAASENIQQDIKQKDAIKKALETK